jgi:hypothetical protein
MKKYVDSQFAAKGCSNVNSRSRDAQGAEEDARLETLLLDGLAGGADVPLTRQFWARLKAQARQIAARRNPGK